ncbi:MAG: hypothetical protein PHV07_02625 [Oscillospiraceae bacterium]|nr:hypothetical protein [Oscillospiraceae bacterium]
MKKLILIIILTFLGLISYTSCCAKPYSFKESVDKIESIEIVSAVTSLEFTVSKTLSEAELEDFLKEFQKIEFYKYLGDPPKLRGDSIRIIYQSGVYEMISSYTAEYVENGVIQFLWKRCDEKAFNNLLKKFLKEESTD